MSDRDGIRLHYDFDVPCHVLLSVKIGDVQPVLRLTAEEARTLARRLNGLADAIEPSNGDERLGKPVRVGNDPAARRWRRGMRPSMLDDSDRDVLRTIIREELHAVLGELETARVRRSAALEELARAEEAARGALNESAMKAIANLGRNRTRNGGWVV